MKLFDKMKNVFSLSSLLMLVLSGLLLSCLASMRYGYYELVRFVTAIGFAYLAYDAFKNKQEKCMIVFGAMALLFQPFMKIALGRSIWNVVDVIVAIGLLYLTIKSCKRTKRFS